MTEDLIFTHLDAWAGGSYELRVLLGSANDARLEHALVALWAHSALDGCYLDRTREPPEQPRLAPGKHVGLESTLLGVATLEESEAIACSTHVVREDGGSDWIYLAIPMGSLGRILPVGAFPFDDGHDLSWRALVDDWLRNLAERLFEAVPFRLGLLGWIDDGDDAEEVIENGVPDERWVGYLVPDSSSLRWYPPTKGAPMRMGRVE